MKSLPHEISCEILSSYNRYKKFACIDLGCCDLKAIVNRKTEDIKVIFKRIYNVYQMGLQTVYEVGNQYGRRVLVCFDERNKIYVSEETDGVVVVLKNFIICLKNAKRYIVEFPVKESRFYFKTGKEMFDLTNKSYIVVHSAYSGMKILDKETLITLGPNEGFLSYSMLSNEDWLVVGYGIDKKKLIRIKDFKCSDFYTNIEGYRYPGLNGNTILSRDYVIVSQNNSKYIFSIKDMKTVNCKGNEEILPIDEKQAKVKIYDQWYVFNIETEEIIKCKK